MDYEKKYKEALGWMQSVYPIMTGAVKEDAEHYFPELKESKESDEERIRKDIISYLKSSTAISPKTWIAWLEKQKVLTTEEDLIGKEDVLWCIKQAKKYAKDENEMGTCWFAEKWLEKQGEQKPAETEKGAKGNDREIPFSGQEWSEEDNLQLQAAIDICKSSGHTITSDWLKSIKDKIQPKQEWSEEDEAKRNALIGLVEEIKNQPLRRLENWDEYISWLKSLRPQKQWKPSEEQIASITCAVRKMKESACYDSELVSLFNDLKKLKE